MFLYYPENDFHFPLKVTAFLPAITSGINVNEELKDE